MSQTEFTSNWLQALMLASDNSAARRIRPWMTDIAQVTAAESSPGQAEAAERLWDYGASHGLTTLLETLPLLQSNLRFEGDESFRFTPARNDSSISGPSQFVELLGFVASEQHWEAEVTQADWTNLLRREAVRLTKGLNVQAIPATAMVRVPCLARWDTRKWTIHFQQPDWLILEQEETLQTLRPPLESLESRFLECLSFASSQFKVSEPLRAFPPTDLPWMTSIETMFAWHRSILVTNDLGLDPWLRRVWAAVWPVVYRERNRLRGSCDLVALRKEVAECFRAAPSLTEWAFLFARLVCELRFERGLGIAADFVDDWC